MSESSTNKLRSLQLGLAVLMFCFVAGCHGGGGHHGDEGPSRHIDPAVIVLDHELILGPEAHDEPARHTERPGVEFDHESHTKALDGVDGCESCHALDDSKRLKTKVNIEREIDDLDSMAEGYHGFCIGCHEDRSGQGQETGPSACGECHRWQPEAESERRAMGFDLSLHQRHVIAEGEDQCSRCHHVYNEETKQLDHRPETESACSDCHTERDRAVKLGGEDVQIVSLREASHASCVNCHRERRGQGRDTGPELCAGCHDEAAQGEIERLENPPRLKRGQPDNRWILTKGATSNLVAFNHEGHEKVTDRCSTCHHQSMRRCGDCHTVAGSAEGGGVNLEQAFHDQRSQHSCVGCHQQRVMDDQNCAGCHVAIGRVPGEAACKACHSGPQPALAKLTEPPPAAQPLGMPTLPAASEDFPTEVVIDTLADQYQPSKLPHREIVETLSKNRIKSALVTRFHDTTQAVPCSGCHHRSPHGERPPPCRACHTDASHPTKDLPSLVAAYHRQCIGCHQQMGLETGCTTCHEEATNRQGEQRRAEP